VPLSPIKHSGCPALTQPQVDSWPITATPEPDFKPGFRVMRNKTSQAVIPELSDEPRSVKLMQSGPLQARRVPDIVNVTCGDEYVTIAAVLPEQRSRNALRLGAHATHMIPAPGLRRSKPQLGKLTSANRVNHPDNLLPRRCPALLGGAGCLAALLGHVLPCSCAWRGWLCCLDSCLGPMSCRSVVPRAACRVRRARRRARPGSAGVAVGVAVGVACLAWGSPWGSPCLAPLDP
jgi:hypothetical protein